MRGVYEAVYKISNLTTGRTLLYLTAPANKVVELIEASVTCVGTNVTNQNLEAAIQRIGTLGTPTATALTPSLTEAGDQAAASVVKGNVTASEPTYTANTEIGYEGGPSLSGWRWAPMLEGREFVGGGASIGIRLLNTLTAADVLVRLQFREIG